jgi:hypothetical protein
MIYVAHDDVVYRCPPASTILAYLRQSIHWDAREGWFSICVPKEGVDSVEFSTRMINSSPAVAFQTIVEQEQIHISGGGEAYHLFDCLHRNTGVHP